MIILTHTKESKQLLKQFAKEILPKEYSEKAIEYIVESYYKKIVTQINDTQTKS